MSRSLSVSRFRCAPIPALLLAAFVGCGGAARRPRSSPQAPVARGAAPLPAIPFAPLWFAIFDSVGRAAGLRSLRGAPLPQGEREVRVWVNASRGASDVLYRIRDRKGAVTGERFDYWPASAPDAAAGERRGETVSDLMAYHLRGRCGGVRVAAGTGVCRSRFRKAPDWAAVLARLDALGIWTLPDPSGRTWDGVLRERGSVMTVELRDGAAYRAYQYDVVPGPAAAADSALKLALGERSASAIADTLRGVDAALRPSEVLRVYRGVTGGERGSAFTACNSREAWEFRGDLRAFATAQGIALPAPGSETRRGRRGYYVELLAQPTPEWLARRQGSAYPRALQAFYVVDVRPWTGAECGRWR